MWLTIEEDRRFDRARVENNLGIPNYPNLGMTCLCFKFIPKLLTAEQKKIRLEVALGNLEIVAIHENIHYWKYHLKGNVSTT